MKSPVGGGVELYLDPFFTSALEEGGSSTPHPTRFTPGNEPLYTMYRRLGGPQGLFGR